MASLLRTSGAGTPTRRAPSRAGCERAREVQHRGTGQILGASMRYGMGYGIFDRSIGWGG
jgi:hypothetical protein